jgi:drug/metabolite transporter (DMT)-like permease
MKIGLLDSGPFAFAGQRTLVGSLFLLCFVFLMKRPLELHRYKEILLLGVFNTVGCVGFSQLSLVNAEASRAAILMFTYPFWTLLLAWPILNERIKPFQWAAIILAFPGLMFVLKPWSIDGQLYGCISAVCGAFSWAIASILIKKIFAKKAIDLLSLTAWQMGFGSLCLLIIAWLSGESLPTYTPSFITALFATGVVSTGLGWLLWVYLLDKLTAGTTSMMTLLVPIIAILSSSWHLGESVSPDDWLGVIMILLALACLTLSSFTHYRGNRLKILSKDS